MIGARKRGQAVADRAELIRRLVLALEPPGVNGVLGPRTYWRIYCCSALSKGSSSSV